MATNIKSSTIANTYDRLVLIEDGATISSGTNTVNIEIQTPAAAANATPLHISTSRVGIGNDGPGNLLEVSSSASQPAVEISCWSVTDTDEPKLILMKSNFMKLIFAEVIFYEINFNEINIVEINI